jgi:RNA polymerase sigma factor (sigma-70 family)
MERLQQRIIEMLMIGEEGLNDRDRELMRLYHLDGLSQKEIAARTGLTQSNVGVILKRTRDRIQKILLAHPSWKDPFAED